MHLSDLLHDSTPAAPKSHRSHVLATGAEVTINGFIRSVQRFKRVGFAQIGDGSTLRSLQVVLQPEQAKLYVAVNRDISLPQGSPTAYFVSPEMDSKQIDHSGGLS